MTVTRFNSNSLKFAQSVNALPSNLIPNAPSSIFSPVIAVPENASIPISVAVEGITIFPVSKLQFVNA